jgi:hypothetical protein
MLLARASSRTRELLCCPNWVCGWLNSTELLVNSSSLKNGRKHCLSRSFIPFEQLGAKKISMSSPKPTRVKPKSKASQFGRELRQLFGKKTTSHIPSSSTSQSHRDSETETELVQNLSQNPAISVEKSSSPSVQPLDVSEGTHPVPSTHSQQSLDLKRKSPYDE